MWLHFLILIINIVQYLLNEFLLKEVWCSTNIKLSIDNNESFFNISIFARVIRGELITNLVVDPSTSKSFIQCFSPWKTLWLQIKQTWFPYLYLFLHNCWLGTNRQCPRSMNRLYRKTGIRSAGQRVMRLKWGGTKLVVSLRIISPGTILKDLQLPTRTRAITQVLSIIYYGGIQGWIFSCGLIYSAIEIFWLNDSYYVHSATLYVFACASFIACSWKGQRFRYCQGNTND